MAKGVMIDGLRIQMRYQEGYEEKGCEKDSEEKMKRKNGG
jgi:hypothetical protein